MFMAIAVGILIFGLSISYMGIDLARLDAKGMTEIHYLGLTFSSTSVALAAIFIGASTVSFVLTRLMKRYRELAALPPQ
jgi:hypothetical protein